MTVFHGRNAGYVARELLEKNKQFFTPQQRRSMLGEIKSYDDEGVPDKSIAVLTAICRILLDYRIEISYESEDNGYVATVYTVRLQQATYEEFVGGGCTCPNDPCAVHGYTLPYSNAAF